MDYQLEANRVAYNVPVVRIVIGENQRQQDNAGFSKASLQALAGSIEKDGLSTPITVRPLFYMCATCSKTAYELGACCGQEREQWYRLVAGERRFRAVTTVLNWETIPAFIEEMDDVQERAVMAHENIGRVDLNAIEEALVYDEFVTVHDLSEGETAVRCGTTEANVNAKRKLLKLVPQAQDLVRRNILPITHAHELAKVETAVQQEALRLIARTAVSFEQFKQYLIQLQSQQIEALAFDFTEFWAAQIEAAAQQQEDLRARALTLPTNANLPPVRGDRKDTAGDIIVRYLTDLDEAGYHSEAAAVGNLFDLLLKLRKVKNFRENQQVALDGLG
jgi:ParB family chromosome partitioning protein